jgi:hypothetical protein
MFPVSRIPIRNCLAKLGHVTVHSPMPSKGELPPNAERDRSSTNTATHSGDRSNPQHPSEATDRSIDLLSYQQHYLVLLTSFALRAYLLTIKIPLPNSYCAKNNLDQVWAASTASPETTPAVGLRTFRAERSPAIRVDIILRRAAAVGITRMRATEVVASEGMLVAAAAVVEAGSAA